MENRLKYAEEINSAMLLVWLAGYYFNNTTIAAIAILGVVVSLVINVVNCFKLGGIKDEEKKIHNLNHIVNQSLLSIGLVVLYYIARW